MYVVASGKWHSACAHSVHTRGWASVGRERQRTQQSRCSISSYSARTDLWSSVPQSDVSTPARSSHVASSFGDENVPLLPRVIRQESRRW
jgi:hypothetical protein